ncbi:MAG: lysoplasmalogenase [Pseudomonadota bacterium]
MQILEYGIDSPQLGSLLFSAAAAFIYLLMVNRPPTARRAAVRALSIGLLAALSTIVGGPLLLSAALLACAAGDALLAQEDDRTFVAGLFAFLAGHLLYIALFNRLGSVEIVVAEPARLAAGAVMVIAAMFATLRFVPAAGPLGPFIGVYIVAIVAMGLSGLLMPGLGVVIGALCLMASDAVRAIEKFLSPQTDGRRSYFVWVSYYLGQVLIALSVLGLA